jgi:hypothetical protein
MHTTLWGAQARPGEKDRDDTRLAAPEFDGDVPKSRHRSPLLVKNPGKQVHQHVANAFH